MRETPTPEPHTNVHDKASINAVVAKATDALAAATVTKGMGQTYDGTFHVTARVLWPDLSKQHDCEDHLKLGADHSSDHYPLKCNAFFVC